MSAETPEPGENHFSVEKLRERERNWGEWAIGEIVRAGIQSPGSFGNEWPRETITGRIRQIQAINVDLAEALATLLEATEHDDVWMPEGLDQPNHPLTLAAAFSEVEAEARREALNRRESCGDCGCHLNKSPEPAYPPSVAKSGTAMRARDQGRCAECDNDPCESFIVCEMEAWKRSVTARMASLYEMPIYDPGASGLPMPKLAVPLHGGPGEPVTGDARTETQRTASCTCGASVTYGAENARQGSPVHARGCDAA